MSLIAVLLVACQTPPPGPNTPDAGPAEPDAGQPPPRTVASVEVAGPENVLVGEMIQLSATVLDMEGKPFEGIRVSWRSSDTTVADVDGEGRVSGMRSGSTVVEASANGKTGRRPVTVHPRPVGSVEVLPTSFSLTVEAQRQMTAVVRDDRGAVVQDVPVTWASSATHVATVNAMGMLEALEAGETIVTAEAQGKRGQSTVTVNPLPVAEVRVSPVPSERPVGSEVQLSAVAVDRRGRVVADAALTWSSLDETRATVTQSGLVTLRAAGAVTLQATSGGVSGSVRVVAFTPFSTIDAGSDHTCGTLLDGRAFCWGLNDWAQLGSGDTMNVRRPVAVAGGLRFRSVQSGWRHSCAVTPENQGYCWGSGDTGRLGIGSYVERALTPTAVAGNLSFDTIVPDGHTCGRSQAGAAYCWGYNSSGQLGDGTGQERNAPVAVVGGFTFASVSAGNNFSCGLTGEGRAYCWGSNYMGQLGFDGDGSASPSAVSGGHLFTQLSVGHEFACGLTGQGEVFCWGAGGYGKLGDGNETFRQPAPVKVSTQEVFAQVSTGAHHACALTSAGRAYCWGHDANGQVGNGAPFQSSVLTPMAVQTEAVFTHVSAGSYHSCALTAAGAVYCWGRNVDGQLGHGSDVTLSPVPVRVLSPGEG